MRAAPKPPAADYLVVVRASDLAALRELVDKLRNSADDTGCQDGLTVIDGAPLVELAAAAEGLRTKPLMQAVFLLHPESEYLDILSLVVPPEVTTEEAREQVLQAAHLVTQGLADSVDPDQDAFLSEVRAMGLWVDNGFHDLAIGAWDAPVPRAAAESVAPASAAATVGEGDTVFVVVQEGGATGELYLSSWPTQEEAEDFRFSCRDDGRYRTSPVVPVPRRLAQEGFYETVELFMRSAAMDLSFPDGDAPDGEGTAEEATAQTGRPEIPRG